MLLEMVTILVAPAFHPFLLIGSKIQERFLSFKLRSIMGAKV